MENQRNITLESMLPKGTVLHDTFRIDSYLASGGFGNTYVATHTLLGKKRVIKEFFMKGVTERNGNSSAVSVSISGKEEFNRQREKFIKEAQLISELDNKNIVKVYDLFEENGTAYYAMDYVEGEDLQRKMEHTGLPMNESEVRKVLSQILDALETVHAKKLWHLDLKPANILLDKNGTVKLIDFGASKQFDRELGGYSSLPIAYTSGYAPTEQTENNHEKIGPWTDFYALGATLYNMLTHKKPPLPSDISDDHTADKHLALPLPSSVSKEMKTLVLRLMKPDRTERPQNVAEIKRLMSRWKPIVPSVIVTENESTKTADKKSQAKGRHVCINLDLGETKTISEQPSIKGWWKKRFPVLALAALVVLSLVVLLHNVNTDASDGSAGLKPEYITKPLLSLKSWKHGLALCAHFTAVSEGYGKKIEDIKSQFSRGFTLDDLDHVYSDKGTRWSKIFYKFKDKEGIVGSIHDLMEMVGPGVWGFVEPEIVTYVAMTESRNLLQEAVWKQGIARCAHYTALAKGFAKRHEEMVARFPQGYTLDDLNDLYGKQGRKWEKIFNEFKKEERNFGNVQDLEELVSPQLWKLIEPEIDTLVTMTENWPLLPETVWKHGLALCAHFTAVYRGFGFKMEDINSRLPNDISLDDMNEVYSKQGRKWETIYSEFKKLEDNLGSVQDLKELVTPQTWEMVEPELWNYFENYPNVISIWENSSL